jgi:2,3-bisphosphoglycerate-independent phosphoglycerate mutase
VSEYLVHNGVSQLAVAETQKFGHVTYFWNGNNSQKFDATLEEWVEIPSDRVAFEHAPAMKAREVCDVVRDRLARSAHRFLRVNFANGDMVGHTGVLAAAVAAMEVVDECVGALERAVAAANGTLIVTADHGNLEMMWDVDDATGKVKRRADGSPVIKTSHTLTRCRGCWRVAADGSSPSARSAPGSERLRHCCCCSASPPRWTTCRR